MINELSDSRRRILLAIKERSGAEVSEVARTLGITHEAARKQMLDLLRSGWITTTCADDEDDPVSAGRPAAQYCLTQAGENLFPKIYASLTLQLLDDAGVEGLARIADSVVERLRERASGTSLAERLAAAREVYFDADDFTSVEQRGETWVVVEKNCPYLDVAVQRPAICSTTVSALRRFTGREVVRERRFQDGDGRCEFHVRGGRARNTRFEIEPPRSDRKP